jgi:replicative DNA helicase
MSDIPDIHRSLPHSVESEKGMLGSMLINSKEVIDLCLQRGVTVEDFHIPSHGMIYRTLVEFHHAGKPLDFITLTSVLDSREELKAVGGAAAVTELFTFVPTSANASYYLETLMEKSLLRKIILRATRLAGRCYDEQDQVAHITEEASSMFLDLALTGQAQESLKHVYSDCLEAANRYEARYHNRGKLAGLSTGFTDFDRMTDGLMGGNVYVIAGRPATGKSCLGMGVAANVAMASVASGKGVCMFSCEMSREQFIDRMVCSEARVDAENLRRGFLSADKMPVMMETLKKMAETNLWIDATSGLETTQFAANSRTAVVKHGCGLIIVDHVQHMRGTDKRSRDNRALELKEIMETITDTAKRLNVPVLVLAQLNREADERPQGRPTMADLKESGAIEEYAYLVGLLWRPIRWAKSDAQKEKLCDQLGIGEEELETFAALIVDKHRNGATGDVRLRFIGRQTRYENADGTRPLYSNNEAKRQEYD